MSSLNRDYHEEDDNHHAHPQEHELLAPKSEVPSIQDNRASLDGEFENTGRYFIETFLAAIIDTILKISGGRLGIAIVGYLSLQAVTQVQAAGVVSPLVCWMPIVRTQEFCGGSQTPLPDPDFEKLVNLTRSFVSVLETSGYGVALAADMTKARISMRELHVQVKVSDLLVKEGLGSDMAEFVSDAEKATDGLHKFGARVGLAFKRIVSFNIEARNTIQRIHQAEQATGGFMALLAAPRPTPTRAEMRKMFKEGIKILKSNLDSLLFSAEATKNKLDNLESLLLHMKEIVLGEKERIESIPPSQRRPAERGLLQNFLILLEIIPDTPAPAAARYGQQETLLCDIKRSRDAAMEHIDKVRFKLKEMLSQLEALGDSMVEAQYAANGTLPLEVQIKTIAAGTAFLQEKLRADKEMRDRIHQNIEDGYLYRALP